MGKMTFDNKPLRELLIEAVRYGNDPAVRTRLQQVGRKVLQTESASATRRVPLTCRAGCRAALACSAVARPGSGHRSERSVRHRSGGPFCPPGRRVAFPIRLPAGPPARRLRLGIPQLPCRTGKAVQLRNMQKGVDGTQFHGGTSQRRVMPVTVRTAPSTTKWTSNPENSIPYTRSGSCW